VEASTFIHADRSLTREEDALWVASPFAGEPAAKTNKPAIDLPTLPEPPALFLSLAHCRTAVHALKALEQVLEEARLEVSPQLRVNPTMTPYILDLGALLFGKRQLSEVRHSLETFGGRLKGILATSVVTTQAAYALGVVLLEAQPEEEPHMASAAHQIKEDTLSAAASYAPAAGENPSTARSALMMTKPSLPLFSRKELNQQAMKRQGAIGAEAAAVSTLSTLYVKSTLRSGRFVDYDGHVVLLGDAHPGSEIRATGDILVWGALRGLAHAGQKGNRKAEIRALRLDALQLRIADLIARRPDQWSNAPGSVASPEPNGSQPANLGELARVLDGEIQIVSAYATLENV
jgi:septum site-determining protein MinC